MIKFCSLDIKMCKAQSVKLNNWDLPVIERSEMFGYGGSGGSSWGVSETASLTPWTDSSN